MHNNEPIENESRLQQLELLIEETKREQNLDKKRLMYQNVKKLREEIHKEMFDVNHLYRKLHRLKNLGLL